MQKKKNTHHSRTVKCKFAHLLKFSKAILRWCEDWLSLCFPPHQLHCDCSFEHFRSSLSLSQISFIKQHQLSSSENALEIIKFYARTIRKREKENPNVVVVVAARESVRVWVAHFLHTCICEWVNSRTYIYFFLAHLSSLSRSAQQHTRLVWFHSTSHNIRPRVCDMALQSQFFSGSLCRTLLQFFILYIFWVQFVASTELDSTSPRSLASVFRSLSRARS